MFKKNNVLNGMQFKVNGAQLTHKIHLVMILCQGFHPLYLSPPDGILTDCSFICTYRRGGAWLSHSLLQKEGHGVGLSSWEKKKQRQGALRNLSWCAASDITPSPLSWRKNHQLNTPTPTPLTPTGTILHQQHLHARFRHQQ